MMKMLDEILRQCGLIGTLIVGGPDPDMPNSMISMIFHTGKNSDRLEFQRRVSGLESEHDEFIQYLCS